MHIYIYVYIYICISICLPVCLSVCLSVTVCLSMSMYLSIHPSIHLQINMYKNMDLHRWDMYIHAWITVILDTIYIYIHTQHYILILAIIYIYTYYALNSCGFVSACKAMAEHPGSALELPPQDGPTWSDPFLFVKKNPVSYTHHRAHDTRG
jgi:hypothetical protein